MMGLMIAVDNEFLAGVDDEFIYDDDGSWDQGCSGGDGQIEEMPVSRGICVAAVVCGEEEGVNQGGWWRLGLRGNGWSFDFFLIPNKRAWAEIFLAQSSFSALLHLFPATCLSYSRPWNEAFLIILPLINLPWKIRKKNIVSSTLISNYKLAQY